MIPAFEAQREAWRRIPVDDVGYLDARELMALGPAEFEALVEQAFNARFDGWRNFEDRWIDLLGLRIPGRSVLDFGCGLGLDALVMAGSGSCVSLADVNGDSIAVATRTLRSVGLEPCGAALIRGEWPYVDPGVPIDTFYASGVLHHIPYAADVIRRAAELVGAGGSIRAMLYSSAAAALHGAGFVRAMDAVGEWAEGYDADRIVREWGDWAHLEYCEPITADGAYLAVSLVAR